MQQTTELSSSAAMLLHEIGGEPLTGSGFETEEAEAEFGRRELSRYENREATQE